MQAENPEPTLGFLHELKQRGVAKMAGWYVASAWVTVQVVQTVQQAFYLSPAVLTFTLIVALIGFPIALLLAWHFDITPDARALEHGVRHRSWTTAGLALLGFVSIVTAGFWVSPARDVIAARRSPKIVCAGGAVAPCRVETTMEANRFVVLPLAHDAGVEPTLLNGEICARLIGDGLSQWRDMKLADPLRLEESLSRLTPDVRMNIPVDTGVAIARELGAGKVIMGRLSQQGDSTRVEAVLYDARSASAVNRVITVFPAGSKQAAAEFAELAKKLVVRDGELAVAENVAFSTNSYAALFAYDSAWKSIGKWNLDDADRHFRFALFHDASFGYAHLWLSYVMLWRNDTTDAWRAHTISALKDTLQFDAETRRLARGVASLAADDMPGACDAYREAIRADSANFHAWFGMGECLSRDSRVVKDARSPSGWSFASSYEAAIRAHRRALQLVPAFNQAFSNIGSSRLGASLFLYANAYRRGVSDEKVEFAAFPELNGDTTSFVPYPLQRWSSMRRPATQQALLERHRVLLRKSAEEWAAAYPRNPRALEAFGLALEQTGELEGSPTGVAALSLLRMARTLESDQNNATRLDLATTRVLFKTGDYRGARKMAKRVLKRAPVGDSPELSRMAGVAGLIGRPRQMGELLAATAADYDYDRPRNGASVEVPQDLARTSARLLSYTYFGSPVDSVRQLGSAAHAIVARERDIEKRELLHEATLDRVARVAFPVIGADDVHSSAETLPLMLTLQRLLVANARQAVRDSLQQLSVRQQTLKPGDMSADGIFTQMQLLLAVGERDSAKALLDRYLDNMHDLAASQFRQPYQPVTLVRLMAARAELAAADRDVPKARKWSRAVIDLWSDGEDFATPTLRRMRALAHLR